MILVGKIALKLPKPQLWGNFLRGFLANMQEGTFSEIGWKQLCPVLYEAPGGAFLIMRRARPLTEQEWDEFDYNEFIETGDGYTVPVEMKPSSFGVLDGRVVAVDYGS